MKTKEEVQKLLEDISNDRAIASAEIPGDVEAKNVALYQIARVRAQERIRDDEQKYKFFIDAHVGLIVPFGPVEKQKEFAAKAQELGQTYTFNVLDVYRKLVQATWAQMGGTGQFTPSNIADIYGMFRLLTRRDLNIFRFRDPEISWMMQHSMRTMDQLAEGVRDSVNRSSGHTLLAKAINKYVCDEAIKNPIARMVVPVVVLEMAQNEIPGYEKEYEGRVVTVDLTDVEDVEASVVEAFNQLKTKLTKSN
jgi:hypothetical protein